MGRRAVAGTAPAALINDRAAPGTRELGSRSCERVDVARPYSFAAEKARRGNRWVSRGGPLAVSGLGGALDRGRTCLVSARMARCGRGSVMMPEARRVNGVLTDDERRVVGAAHQLGLILSS